MSDLPDECCAKCQFWWLSAKDTYGEQDGVYGDGTHSYCRRFPKAFIGLQKDFKYLDWEYPVHHDSDWCGEFKVRS